MALLLILWKDLRASLRSPFVLAFLLVLPLAQTGLPYLAFRGFSREVKIDPTRVAAANLDRPVADYPDFLAGDLLMAMFADPSLTELLQVEETDSEAAARARVDAGSADVALVIPADFTATLFDAGRRVTVQLYADPVKTFGPRLVHEVAVNFLDGFSGSQMAADVAAAQNPDLTAAQRRALMQRYGDWAQTIGDALRQGHHPAIEYIGEENASASGSVMDKLIGPMLAGMLVFFGFLVAGICALSFLRERERGTLHRLMTTPVNLWTVMAGKAGAVVAVIAMQAVLLLGLGAILFGIVWGEAWRVACVAAGFAICASGFGTLLVSFLRTSRQAFLVLGGLIVLTSAVGGTMTTTFAELPVLMDTVRLFTPQGWVLRAFEAAMNGGSVVELFLCTAVSVGIGMSCLWMGCANVRRQIL